MPIDRGSLISLIQLFLLDPRRNHESVPSSAHPAAVSAISFILLHLGPLTDVFDYGTLLSLSLSLSVDLETSRSLTSPSSAAWYRARSLRAARFFNLIPIQRSYPTSFRSPVAPLFLEDLLVSPVFAAILPCIEYRWNLWFHGGDEGWDVYWRWSVKFWVSSARWFRTR